MAHPWTYTTVYEAIVRYIHDQLIPQNYSLNFGVVALCETAPKVYLRFTLKDLMTDRSRQWEVQVEGYTIQELVSAIGHSIEENKFLL